MSGKGKKKLDFTVRPRAVKETLPADAERWVRFARAALDRALQHYRAHPAHARHALDAVAGQRGGVAFRVRAQRRAHHFGGPLDVRLEQGLHQFRLADLLHLLRNGVAEMDAEFLALVEELERRLERGEQALLFLNRRGWAPVLSCASCLLGTAHRAG